MSAVTLTHRTEARSAQDTKTEVVPAVVGVVPVAVRDATVVGVVVPVTAAVDPRGGGADDARRLPA